MKPFITKSDLGSAVQKRFKAQFILWNYLRCRPIQFGKMSSILKKLFSLPWWIYNPYSATHIKVLVFGKMLNLYIFSLLPTC